MVEPLPHAAFYDVRQSDDAQHSSILRNQQWSSATVRDVGDGLLHLLGDSVAALSDIFRDRIGRAFADLRAVEIDSRHSRLRGEGNERRIQIAELPAAKTVFFFHENDDGTTLWGLVG